MYEFSWIYNRFGYCYYLIFNFRYSDRPVTAKEKTIKTFRIVYVTRERHESLPPLNYARQTDIATRRGPAAFGIFHIPPVAVVVGDRVRPFYTYCRGVPREKIPTPPRGKRFRHENHHRRGG